MLQHIRIMAAQTCSRRSLHMSRSLSFEKVSSNIQSAAEQLQLSSSVLAQALTHKSFKHGNVPDNERLQLLGRRSMEYFVVDLNNAKNAEELAKIIKRNFGLRHLGARFDALGLEQNVQYNLPSNKTTPLVKSQAVQALVGAVYHEHGLSAAKEFVKKNIFV